MFDLADAILMAGTVIKVVVAAIIFGFCVLAYRVLIRKKE